MPEEDLQTLVDRLAAQFRRSVAIDDPRIRLIAASRHFGEEDSIRLQSILHREVDPDIVDWIFAHGVAAWESSGRLPGRADIDLRPRVCQPIRTHGLLLGFLWIIEGDDQLAPSQMRDLEAAAERAGQLLYRRLVLGERAQAHREDVLRRLLSPDADLRREARDEVSEESLLTTLGPAVIFALQVDTPGDTTGRGVGTDLEIAVVDAAEQLRAQSSLVLAQSRRATLLHILSGNDQVQVTAERVKADVQRRLHALGHHRARCVLGVGTPVVDISDVTRSYRQARSAAHAAQLLPSIGTVASWDSLGPYAVLLEMSSAQAAELLPPSAQQLLDQDTQETLCRTAETYLDLAGNATRSAEQLHIHRATLHQRLRTIEAITGLNLHDGLDRLTLHLSLKLLRLHGMNNPPTQDHRKSPE